MVRKYSRKSERGAYGESKLAQALDSIKSGTALLKVSRQYGIPARTLRRHRDNKVRNPGTLQLGRYRNTLPEEVELELKNHIVSMERMMFGLTVKDIRKLAYDLVIKMNVQHPFNNETKMAGSDWVNRFMVRQNLTLRQPQGTSISRAAGFNQGEVTNFFELYKELLEQYQFPPSRIWNADESGLTTVQTPHKVLAAKGIRSVGKITSAERGVLVTMLCACNAAGSFIPPLYVFPRQRMSDNLMKGAPPQAVGYASKNGWIDQDIFLKWLEHFVKMCSPSKENPHLIILDGHHSHKTLAAIDYCTDNGIHLLTLPPHSTHRMQPLDRTYFKPLKSAFNGLADSFMVAHPGRRITVYDMAGLTGTAFLKTALSEKAVHGIKACGLYPFDPNVFSAKDFTAVLKSDSQETTPLPFKENLDPNSDNVLNSSSKDTYQSDETTQQDPSIESGITSENIDTVISQSVSGFTPVAANDDFTTIHVQGDGRCLFRSIVVGLHDKLVNCPRTADGKPADTLTNIFETIKADELRAKVILYMSDHIKQYSDITGDAVNADLPERLRFSTVFERVQAMANPTAFVGELEISVVCEVLSRPLWILNKDRAVISMYGEPNRSEPIFVQFESIGENVGHYDCLIKTGKNTNIGTPCYDATSEPINCIIEEIYPTPTRPSNTKKARKKESSAVLTSSPYKTILIQKTTKKSKPSKGIQNDVRSKILKRPGKTSKCKNADQEQDWACIVCGEMYSNSRPKDIWVQCQACSKWAHEECTQGLPQFVCPVCE